MTIRNLIILSQLNPPGQQVRVLQRQRLLAQLKNAFNYPLTILEAGTGYGKTTTILSFLECLNQDTYWFSVSGVDRDPRLFLAKLFTAFNQHSSEMGESALRILESPDSTPRQAMIAFINALTSNLQKDCLFVIDDFHRVSDVPEILNQIDWMLPNLPNKLHVMLATRHNPQFTTLTEWRAKGKVLEITKNDLVFTVDEAKRLFSEQYQLVINETMIQQILDKTEGWAIGLQMFWQTIRNNPEVSIEQVLEDEKESKTALFEFLADDVLGRLPEDYQDFLLKTSLLSKLDSLTCDFLLNSDNSEELLRDIENKGLFIEELHPGVYRYHQIFRQFLASRLQLAPHEEIELHQKLASYFQAHEYWEEAIYHLLNAKDYGQINQILESIGEKFILSGRQESIHYWINEIPSPYKMNYPHLYFMLGEINRYRGRFDEALENYHIAERLYRKKDIAFGVYKTIRGQAQVFLDTIRPSSADQLLQKAIKLLNPAEMPEEVADILTLTAENQLNLGFPESAQSLLDEAQRLRHKVDRDADLIQSRIFLRTGQIENGISLLQSLENERPTTRPSRPQRFHRESTLLLSLFHAIKGEIEDSENYARIGIEIGNLLQSTFVSSVGLMRLGHAILLQSQHPFTNEGFRTAIQMYQDSIEKVNIVRIHAEPLWGMCRALGYTNQLVEAKRLATESLEIVNNAGDQWMGVLIKLSIGAGAVIAHEYNMAQDYLIEAEATAIRVKDPLVVSYIRLWLAINAWQQGFENTAFGYLEKLLALIFEHGYEFLLFNQTFMGLRDTEVIYPLLIKAYRSDIAKESIGKILCNRGLNHQIYHPGYSLWVRTFGGFCLWRGDQRIDATIWKREKARHLFQLLVANRNQWLHRDQLLNMLWGDKPIEKADNYLKVILNALNQVLEPDRPKGAPYFFIEREQDRYRLNPLARIIVDADLFTLEINNGTSHALHKAVKLYKGRYFDDNYVQEFFPIDEQYYHQQFLLAAEKITNLFIDEGKFEQALEITHKILCEDELYEPAYRLQMTIFSKMGKTALLEETFKRCQNTFLEQLDMPLSEITIQHYKSLLANASKNFA